MRKQSVIYLGLFLMMFGLYAAQLKKKAAVKTQSETPALVTEEEEIKRTQTRVQLLYEKVSALSVFRTRISGIRLLPASPPVKNDFMISLSGDEIYNDGGFSIHESWGTVLDSLAVIIKAEPGLSLEISGFADENNPKEKAASDYGSSALAFSYARAEWLAHYFERKHGIEIQKTFVLRGMGAIPMGKRIDLRLYYSKPSSGAF